MSVVEAPARLQLGSRFVVQARRWGITQRMVSEITAFQPDVMFTDTQRQGPFKKWVHTHLVDAVDGKTRSTDRVEYEAPGGLLGLVMTSSKIERELQLAVRLPPQGHGRIARQKLARLRLRPTSKYKRLRSSL